MLTIEHKLAFSSLAGQLSPENLSCDGELRGRALQTKANRLRREWAALEKQVGRKVTEDETWSWHKELSEYHAAKRAAEMAAQPQHPLLRHSNVHVWSREGGKAYAGAQHGQSAYYIQNHGGAGTPFILFSEFAHVVFRKEKLGEFDTLDAAAEAGELFLRTVKFSTYRQHTQYTDENIKRELTRLPLSMQEAALAG
jgi:hypothetical protein